VTSDFGFGSLADAFESADALLGSMPSDEDFRSVCRDEIERPHRDQPVPGVAWPHPIYSEAPSIHERGGAGIPAQ
jgi:hypothetical protein